MFLPEQACMGGGEVTGPLLRNGQKDKDVEYR